MMTVPGGDQNPDEPQGTPPPTPREGYSLADMVKPKEDAEGAGLLRTTFNAAQEIPPDRAKRVLTLMGKTGIDADLLDTNLEEAEAESAKPNFDPETFRKTSPVMSRWLEQSPHHMRLVQDDLLAGKLGDLEKIFARKDDTSRALSDLERAALARKRAQKLTQMMKIAEATGMPFGPAEPKTDLRLFPFGERISPKAREGIKAALPEDLSDIEPDPEILKDQQAQIDAEEEFIASTGKMGLIETGKRVFKDNPLFFAPFIGSVVDVVKHAQLFEAAKAMKDNNATDEQKDFLVRFGRLADAAERRGTNVWGKVAEIVSGLPAFAGEFALTGGLYRSGKMAAEILVKDAVKTALRGSARWAARQVAGGIGGSLVRTAVGLPRLMSGTIERMTPGIDIKADDRGRLEAVLSPNAPDDFVPALAKTFGDQFVENFSELSGVVPEKALEWLKPRLFKDWVKLHPREGTSGFLNRVAKATGWNGVLGEMFEERVGEVMKAGLGLEKYKFPSGEQLLAEFLAFGVPSSPGHVVERWKALTGHGEAQKRVDDEKGISAVLKGLGVTQTAPEVAGPMIEEISKIVNQGTDREFKYIDPVKVKAYYEQKGVDPKARMTELMGSPEAYQQALDNGHDLQVPTHKYDAYVAGGEDATFWQSEAVNAPGQETVSQTEERLKKLDEQDKARVEAAKAPPTPAEEAQAEKVKISESGAQRVRQVVEQGLEQAGRSRAEIRHAGSLVSNVFRTLGERMGQDPWELFRNYNLKVAKGTDEAPTPEEAAPAGVHYVRVFDQSGGGQHVEAFEAPTPEEAVQLAQAKWADATIEPLTDAEVQQFLPTAMGEGPSTGKPETFHQLKPGQEPKGYKAIAPHLSEAERTKLKTNTAKTLVEIFNALPSDKDFADAAKAGQAKRGWYENSTAAIREVFGDVDAPRFAALLAAMSPQVSVESNLFNATSTWKNWVKAGRPTDRKAIIKIMGESVQGDKGADSVLDAWVNNSVRALSTANPASIVLSGPKVNSFMENLRGQVNEVTNDAWMANFAAVDQKIFGGSLNVSGTEPGKTPGYMAMVAKIRRVAEQLTKETGEKWTPAEVQETIWSWAKTVYELAAAEGEKRSAVELVKQGAITDAAIAETPDFEKLFTQDATIRRILEEAGYGTALNAVEAEFGSGSLGGAGSPAEGRGVPPGKASPGLLRSARRLDDLRAQRLADEAVNAEAKKAGKKVFHQPQKPLAPIFHSKLRKVIEAKMPARASAEQLRGIVKDIKGEELQWLGLNEFLENHKDDNSISKEQVLAWIEMHDLGVKDVLKGDILTWSEVEAGTWKSGLYKITMMNDGTFRLFKRGRVKGSYDNREQAQHDAEILEQEGADIAGRPVPGTKYQSYTLSGGKDYRELLLTLPDRTGAKDRMVWKTVTSEETDKEIADLTEKLRAEVEIRSTLKREIENHAPHSTEWEHVRAQYAISTGRVSNLESKLSSIKQGWGLFLGDKQIGQTYNYEGDEAFARQEARPALGKADPTNFHGSHFDEANVLAHVRFNERVDADGKRVLFIEEIQSDWHQMGRKRGYASAEKGDRPLEALSREELIGVLQTNDPNGTWGDAQTAAEGIPQTTKAVAIEQIRQWQADDPTFDVLKFLRVRANTDGVPDAPFKKTWHEFALKRMIRYAAENGFDRIAWTSGTQQADRYDLSKQIDELSWYTPDGKTWNIAAILDGRPVMEENELQPEEIEKYVGKEIAQKIVARAGEEDSHGGQAEGVLDGVDLKVGGEGMKEFYDKMLPSFANKFGKKYGAQVETIELPGATGGEYTIEDSTDGRRDEYFNVLDPHGNTVDGFSDREDAEDLAAQLNDEQKANNSGVHSMEITPDLKDAALNEGFSLFQPGGRGNRGRITIGSASIDIALLEGADRSTFQHELGHFYLEVLADLAERADAPQDVRDDYKTVLDWFGVKSRAEVGEDQHEMWARGFERYLAEGKAPSTALRRAFWHFKVMFTRIYKTFLPGANLSDPVRKVMDRLIATEEEIANAHADYGRPLYTVLLNAGMDPNRAAKLAKATEDAKIANEDRLRVRALRDVLREEKADAKANRARIREEILKEVNERQDVKLLANLQDGTLPDGSPLPEGQRPVKLWDDALKEADYVQAGALPDGVTATRAEGAEHPDAVAYLYGFQNAGEMINALAQIGDKDQFIERLTDERMIDRYGPPMTEVEMQEAAEAAVHSKEREVQLRLELEELVEKDLASYKTGVRTFASKPRIPDAEVVRRKALEDVGKLTIREIKPALYRHAEVRAARLALEAALKGDWTTAADEQLKQYLNFVRFNVATAARESLKKSLELVRKVSKGDKGLSKTHDMDLVNAARSVLANYGIGRFDKQPDVYLKQLKKYDPDTYEALAPQIEDALQGAKDYRDVPFSQFQSMMETVAGFWDLARETKQMEVGGERVEIETVGDILGNDLKDLGQPHAKAGYHRNNTAWEDAKIWMLGAKARLRRVESWVDAMGANFKKFIWRPIVEATDRYRTKRTEAIRALYKAAKEMGQLKKGKIEAPEIGYTFDSEGELVMALLHSGNESNLRKLLLGREWGGQDENGNLDISTWERFRQRAMREGIIEKRHYDFAQAVWDLFEDLKPDAQRAHKAMFGRYFSEVTADEVQTPWATYRGGYMPAKTDPRFVTDQAVREDREAIEGFNNSFAWPTTGRGATIKRIEGYTKALSLNFNLIPQHIDWALRFAHIEPRVREVARLLRNRELRSNLDAFDPKVGHEMLTPWLQRAATQRTEDGPRGPLDQFWRFVRRSAGMQIMALNVPNALQNLTGLSVAATKVAPKHLRNALFTYAGNPAKFAEAIRDKSEMMRARTDGDAMEMMGAIEDIVLDGSIFHKIQRAGQKHAYALQRLTQNAIDNVAWGAAYEQATEQGMTDPEAVQEANAVVRLTQGGTNAEDIARYEAGSPFQKLMTQFTGFFNMKANLMGTEFAKEIRKSGLKAGAGRMFYLYSFGHMIPAAMAAAIFKIMSGGWSDDDDDGYLDELMATFFGSQVKELIAMAPGFGQAINTAIGGFTPEKYDDRVNISPAIQAIERAVTAPGEIYKAALEGKGGKKATKDALSMLGLFSALPTSVITRPLGYAMDAADGTTKPGGGADYLRGLVTGKNGPKK